MTHVGIIISSIRPNRFADHPARWIKALADRRRDIDAELLDLKDYPMPLFAEAASPAYARSENAVARRWQKAVDGFDAFVVVTAEYNHGPTAAMKNALDYAFSEWRRKPIAFVGYGSAGGARAIQQLRQVAVELEMAPIRTAVNIQWPVYMAVTKEGKKLDSFDFLQERAGQMFDELVWWADALSRARARTAERAFEPAE